MRLEKRNMQGLPLEVFIERKQVHIILHGVKSKQLRNNVTVQYRNMRKRIFRKKEYSLLEQVKVGVYYETIKSCYLYFFTVYV